MCGGSTPWARNKPLSALDGRFGPDATRGFGIAGQVGKVRIDGTAAPGHGLGIPARIQRTRQLDFSIDDDQDIDVGPAGRFAAHPGTVQQNADQRRAKGGTRPCEQRLRIAIGLETSRRRRQAPDAQLVDRNALAGAAGLCV